MQFKTRIKEVDEAGFITFTRDELNEVMLESYQRGYNDGLYQAVPYDIDKTDIDHLLLKQSTKMKLFQSKY